VIIQQAIWLYVRFTLSFRDVEDLLAERGVMVSYETIRRWVNHFGPMIAADLRKRRPKPHTTWHLDEVYLKMDVGSHLGVRIWNFDPKKPSNVRIPTNYILTLDGSAGGLNFKRRRLV